jgi:hypothetical protein
MPPVKIIILARMVSGIARFALLSGNQTISHAVDGLDYPGIERIIDFAA